MYTKGDWKIDTGSIATVVLADVTKVAVVYGYSDEEERSNARLIAASPKLYEALKKAQKCLNNSATITPQMDFQNVRAVLPVIGEALALAEEK